MLFCANSVDPLSVLSFLSWSLVSFPVSMFSRNLYSHIRSKYVDSHSHQFVFMCTIPDVDWAAHVGGLLGGFVMGFIIFSLGIESRRWKTALFSMGCMIALVFYGMGVFFMIKERKDDVALEMEDVCKYYQGFFEDYECNCQLGDE